MILEDGLKDVESLEDSKEEEKRDALKLADKTSDVVGTSYLKIINNVSFSDLSIYTVYQSMEDQTLKKLRLHK